MDLTIFIGKKSFMTYNITSFKNTIWISWSFLKWLVEEKNPKITIGVTMGA
jgi:hypothetical protein